MFRKMLATSVCGLFLGVVGCTHNQGSAPMPESTPATPADATTMPSMNGATMAAPANESMMDKAKDMLKKGQEMLAKGKVDGNPEEQTTGQKMIDEARAMMDKAKGKMSM